MSDPTQAAESAEAAQSAVESAGSPPPWGDDFNPERAWQTITHLRGREKELESDAKQLQKLREDEDARREFLTELGYEIADGEEDEQDEDLGVYDDQDDDPLAAVNQRLSKFEQWQQEQSAQEAMREFRSHVDELAGESKLSDQEIQWVFHQSLQNGFNRNATENAYKQLQAWLGERDETAVKRYLEKKRAPTPPQTGTSGTVDRKPGDRNARREQMAALIAAQQEEQ